MKTSFLEKMVVCLFVFNVAFKHLKTYCDGAFFDQYAEKMNSYHLNHYDFGIVGLCHYVS